MLLTAAALYGQGGQEGPKPDWPCVPGRAVDPAYLETSESTGGQAFLFQKSEVAKALPFMLADTTHPATIVRAIGTLSRPRDFEFAVDSTVRSLLVMASIQCRSGIGVFRPSGTEITAASSTENVELQAGRAIKVDNPGPGKWKVRLEGTGLFILSVRAQSPVKLAHVEFVDSGSADAAEARTAGKTEPRAGTPQWVKAFVSGEVSKVEVQVADASGDVHASASADAGDGGYLARVSLAPGRFRLHVTGTDASGWPFERVYPMLFRARPAN